MAKITLANLYDQQRRAVARLHLKFTADTHRIFRDFFNGLRAELDRYTLEDGRLNPLGLPFVNNWIAENWQEMFGQFKVRFEQARREAALISFGVMAIHNRDILVPLEAEFAEAGPPDLKIEGIPFWDPQLDELIKAANERVYSDGFKLSQRIWNLDNESRAKLQAIIVETIATGESAWDAAQRLEELLGAQQDCPRWTSTRLNKLTKSDIAAGDPRGLIRGPSPCSSKGVAYNALRLARNEIQIVHQRANDEIFRRIPWVEQEKVNLSPSHPAIGCRCESVVVGGENGDGVYPVGEIILPLHPMCLCHKTAVLLPPDQMAERLRGWVTGETAWPEMDEYKTWVGSDRSQDKEPADALGTWSVGKEKDMNQRLG